MQGPTDSKSAKRLGDLLLEAGYVAQEDLNRAIGISQKNFQSLGKVLVSSKICKEQDINNALEMQKMCKLEGMTGGIAIRILSLMRTDYLSKAEALNRVGWTSESYLSYKEPEPIVAAKNALKASGLTAGLEYGQLVEKIGDAYLDCKLTARAEVKFEDALLVYEACLPESASDLGHLLGKLGQLALQQKRHTEAKAMVERAQETLKKTGNKDSRAYARILHVSAEYHLSRRKFSEAELHLIDCFDMLSSMCGLEDEHTLQTVSRYIEVIAKAQRDTDKVTLGELFKGAGVLSEEQLDEAFKQSKIAKAAFGRTLVVSGLITEEQLQLALQTQLMVRNGEISAQLAIWIVLYSIKTKRAMDEVFELFKFEPKSRGVLAAELKSASYEMANMEARLSANHPDLAFAHAKVARIFFQRQQWIEAEHHFKRALMIFSSSPLSYTEKAIEVIDHYCELKAAQEDLEETVRIAKIALQMRIKHYGQISIPYVRGLENLAQIFCNKGDHEMAIGCLDKALEVREKLYGDKDRELILCLEARGDCLEHLKNFADAEAVFERAFSIADDIYGRAHEVSDRILQKLVFVLKSAGNYGRVQELLPGSSRDVFMI